MNFMHCRKYNSFFAIIGNSHKEKMTETLIGMKPMDDALFPVDCVLSDH